MSDKGFSRSYRKERERKRSSTVEKKEKEKIEPAPVETNTDNTGTAGDPVAVAGEPLVEQHQQVTAEPVPQSVPEPEPAPVDNTEEEKAILEQYIQETGARIQWKNDLRKQNQDASTNRPDDDKHLYKLDSSLKKNTAFIRKCKAFSEGQKAQLLKEMNGLNLTKYIGELTQALVECKLKMSDITAMVELCSAVHQKYAEFGPCLLENWSKVLTMKKEEKVANPSKLRVDLRLYSELIATGIFKLKER